jgi:hypothetical protein
MSPAVAGFQSVGQKLPPRMSRLQKPELRRSEREALERIQSFYVESDQVFETLDQVIRGGLLASG